MVTLIQTVYQFLWGDLITLPLPGGASISFSLLVLLLIPTGIYFCPAATHSFPCVYLRICCGLLWSGRMEKQPRFLPVRRW